MAPFQDSPKLSPPGYLEGSKRRQASPTNPFFMRYQLVHWLESQPMGKPGFIIAPDGSGKTSLVSSWIKSSQEANQHKLTWLTLDETDNDPVRFLGSLVAALHRAQPGMGTTLLAELATPQQPDLPFLLANLFREIASAGTLFTCVIDDCHVITSVRLQKILTELMIRLPWNLRLFLIFNKEPSEELEAARQSQDWQALGMSDLEFKPDEVTAYLSAIFHIQVDEEQASLIATQTQGLVLGVHLAGLALQNHPNSVQFWEALKKPPLPGLEYLLDQALDRQMEAVRDFLLFTSFLEKMAGPLCDQVLRASPHGLQTPGRGQATLEHLSTSKFLTFKLDNEKKWFSYHPLFAQILQTKLSNHFPGSLVSLHQRASQWFEQNGEVELAISHALAADDEERASDLVEFIALSWVGKGYLSTVLSWMGRLTAGRILLRPWLCLAEAWATAGEGWQQGTETLLAVSETAAEAFTPSAAQRARGHVAAVRLQLNLLNQDFTNNEALARRALELLPPQDRAIRCHVAIQLGLHLQQSGRLSQAAEAFTEAVACAQQGENRAFAVLSLCRLADNHLAEGLLQKVLTLCEEALSIARIHQAAEGYILWPAGLAHIFAGMVRYERDELELAQSHFENGIAYSESWGMPDFAALSQVLLAETYYARGSTSYTQETLKQVPQASLSAPPSSQDPRQVGHAMSFPYLIFQPNYLGARLAALHLEFHQIEEALAWLERFQPQPLELHNFSQTPIYISVVKILISQNRMLEARRLLRQLTSMSEAAGAQNYLIRGLVLQAQLMQLSNDYPSALATLKKALLLAEQENYVRTFIDGDPGINPLLHRLSERGPGSSFAKAILNAIDQQVKRVESGETADAVPLSTRPLTQSQQQPEKLTRESFTDREREVLRLLDSYLGEVEISYRLSISTRTVDTLVRNICRKLNVHDAQQAVARARELKIL